MNAKKLKKTTFVSLRLGSNCNENPSIRRPFRWGPKTSNQTKY